MGYIRLDLKNRLAPPPELSSKPLMFEPPLEVKPEVPVKTGEKIFHACIGIGTFVFMGMAIIFGGRAFSAMIIMMGIGAIMGLISELKAVFGTGEETIKLDIDRIRYARYLSNKARKEFWNVGEQMFANYTHISPPPETLHSFIGSERMWERQPGNAQFGFMRAGIGDHKIAVDVNVPDVAPADHIDPLTAQSARNFLLTHQIVRKLPTRINFRDYSALIIDEKEENAGREWLYAMICHVATFHSSDAVKISALVSPEKTGLWEPLKWLPHTMRFIGDPLEDVVENNLFTSLDLFEKYVGTPISKGGAFVKPEKELPNSEKPKVEPHHIIISDGLIPRIPTSGNANVTYFLINAGGKIFIENSIHFIVDRSQATMIVEV